MIRKVLVTAIALVAAWNSSTLVFARVDQSQFQQPVPGLEAHTSPAVPIQLSAPSGMHSRPSR